MITGLRQRVARGGVAMGLALALATPLAGTAAAASTAPAAPAPAAESATVIETVNRCGGTRIRHKAIKAGTRTIGYVNVYRGDGRKKCVRTYHAGPSWGKYRYTVARLWNDNYGSGTTGATVRYKGPGIRSTGIRCVNVHGYLYWNGTKHGSRINNICTS